MGVHTHTHTHTHVWKENTSREGRKEGQNLFCAAATPGWSPPKTPALETFLWSPSLLLTTMSHDSNQNLKDRGGRKRQAEKTEGKKVKWGDGAGHSLLEQWAQEGLCLAWSFQHFPGGILLGSDWDKWCMINVPQSAPTINRGPLGPGCGNRKVIHYPMWRNRVHVCDK